MFSNGGESRDKKSEHKSNNQHHCVDQVGMTCIGSMYNAFPNNSFNKTKNAATHAAYTVIVN